MTARLRVEGRSSGPSARTRSFVVDADHEAQTLALGFEARMSQEPPDEPGRVIWLHVQQNQAVSGMDKMPPEESSVLGEKCDPPQPMEQRDHLRVLDAQARKLASDLTEGNPPLSQRRSLVLRKVLVQEIQAAASEGRLGNFLLVKESSQASRASLSASAIAASGMRPPQRVLQIKSQDRPAATSSSASPPDSDRPPRGTR